MKIDQQYIDTIQKLDKKQPYVWLATWFGFGFFKPAPGTWGSLAAIPFAILIYQALGLLAFLCAIILVTLIGLWAAEKFDAATDGHDNKMIVIDEVAGQWIALLPALYLTGMNSVTIALGFVLFRFFDIIKPWPISWLDRRVSGGLGVMIDDILAGFFAALCLKGLIHYAALGY